MTIGSVELAAIQQALSDMQSAATFPGTALGLNAPGDSFSATLAQATSDLSATGGSSGTGGDALIVGCLATGAGASATTGSAFSLGGSPSEQGLVALLLSAHPVSNIAAASAAPKVPLTARVQLGAGGVTGHDVVNMASRFEGTPYVWGGTSPRGFDCSGFAQYVYGQLGINLPRTSEEQATVGTPVASLSDARPGDLIFFAGSDGTAQAPGHVGIYVGNGEMIDAPYTGTTVQVQSLSGAGPVVSIRRVLASAIPGAT